MTIVLTALAMLALASNSILSRQALGQGLIDAASFTLIRVASGALALALICLSRRQAIGPRRSDWPSAAMLFAYMACFSFAYLSLSAGTGALILFGAVQITMIIYAVRSGETLTILSWSGLTLAVFGLIWLVFPGLTAPHPVGALLMTLAGIAWGIYSLLGRRAGDPTVVTTRNFILATPMCLILMLGAIGSASASWPGILLAIVSGAVTSGLGYVLWYFILPRFTATGAASIQLTIPVIAAALGVALLDETLTLRLILASAAVLSGVGIVVLQRSNRGR